MNKIALIAAALAVTALTACTDVQKAHYGTYGKSAHVVCYSGGKKIFDDFSTGQVTSEDSGAGYQLVAKSTNRLIHVSGDCSLDYGAEVTPNWHPIHPEDGAA